MAKINEEASDTVVFLPATRPGETTFGRPPGRLEAFPHLRCASVPFDRQVWYNASVCASAAAHIRTLPGERIILVGFSKSALGAWTLTRLIGPRVRGTILFDGPVARDQCPPWETSEFYASDEAWQQDLPLRTIEAFRRALAPDHRLVLIPGTLFREEMAALSAALRQAKHPHAFLDQTDHPHYWNTHWIEAALAALVPHTPP